jgi:hypothetical protein
MMSGTGSKVSKEARSPQPKADGPKPTAKPAPAESTAAPEWSRPGVSRRPIFRQVASFLFSMMVHMGLLIFLGLWVLPEVVEVVREFATFPEVDRNEEDFTELADASAMAGTSFTASKGGSGGGGSVGGGSGTGGGGLPSGHGTGMAGLAVSDGIDKEAVGGGGRGTGIGIGDGLGLGNMRPGTMILNLPEGAPGDAQAPTRNMAEAMDRITREIILMLENGKVHITWLFDESESMKEEQKDIRDKIERVYKELGLIGALDKKDYLTSAVASFGKELHIHTQTPTPRLDTFRYDMDKIKVDETGKENLCYSINQTINYYRTFCQRTQRQMAMIVLTDESGEKDDSVKWLETALQSARDARCRIYFLGREAVFGYLYAYMNWKDPKTEINYWLQIDRGPETPYAEQLQTEGFWHRHDAHSSGFGPFEQSRLARETGGIFFILPSPEVNIVAGQDFKYSLERMRPYMPNLESREQYVRERERSKMQQVLWKVINDLNPWDDATGKIINLRHAYAIDPAEFAKQAQVEMGKMEKYVKYLHRAEEELDAALPLRKREVYSRWQANFDLIHAQVLAYKIRVYQYGAYLHWFISNPNERPKPALRPPQNNPNLVTYWYINYRPQTIATDKYPRTKMEEDIKKATAMFQKIMKDYEGTPWAKRAEWELSRNFGVHVTQGWDDRRRGAAGVKLPKL